MYLLPPSKNIITISHIVVFLITDCLFDYSLILLDFSTLLALIL